MSSLFAITLIGHVILGIIGVMASYVVLLNLLKKTLSLRTLEYAALTACVSYILSWFAGGYYYVFYYGSNVKPVIKEGAYPWAHLVLMEAKEHIFLFLPFATLVLYLAIKYYNSDLDTDATKKRNIIVLSAVITIIATLITLSGILITGGAQ